MLTSLIIHALLTSSAFYLGSRALITQPLWSRYPRWLASWADCAACSGAWYGLMSGLLLRNSLPMGSIPPTLAPVLIGLCAIVWTPIVSGYMQLSLERLGSAMPDEGEDPR